VFIIRIVLLISALSLLIYPTWGLINPSSYLVEILEVYPHAEGVSETQVQKAALILFFSNFILCSALFFLAKFINNPQNYKFAKLSAIALICYPIVLTIVEIFTSSVLYSHLDNTSTVIEFSAMKLFYIIFGLAVVGIYKSQRELNKPL